MFPLCAASFCNMAAWRKVYPLITRTKVTLEPANLIYVLAYIIHTFNWVYAFRDKKSMLKK